MFRSAFWCGRLAKELTNLVPYNNESSFSAILAVLCDNDMECNIPAGIKQRCLHSIKSHNITAIICTILTETLPLPPKRKEINRTVTALNPEFLRELSYVAEDESMMKQLSRYVHCLFEKKQDETLFTEEDFHRKLERSSAQAAEGKYMFLSIDLAIHNFLYIN